MSNLLPHLKKRMLGGSRPHTVLRLLFLLLGAFEGLSWLGLFPGEPQFTWLGLFLTWLAVFSGLEIAAYYYERKKKAQLPWAMWLIAFLCLSIDMLGDLLHFYERFLWWDQFVHFFVSANAAFIIFVIISAFWLDRFSFRLLGSHGRLNLTLFMAATATLSLSALYEIEEYLEDVIFGSNRLGAGADTADDLLFNTLGVLLMVIVVKFLLSSRRARLP